MAKSITAAQRRKISEDIALRVRDGFGNEITQLDGYDGYLGLLAESLLDMIADYTDAIIKKALSGWEVQFERDENARVTKLEAEAKELRKRNRELSAIEKLVNDAKNSVD